MANKRTGPDYLDQQSKKKKNTQIRAVRKPSSFGEGDNPTLDWKRGGLKRYDPEVLEKLPHRPHETIGVSMMRDKMQQELDKKKGKTKTKKKKKPSQKAQENKMKNPIAR